MSINILESGMVLVNVYLDFFTIQLIEYYKMALFYYSLHIVELLILYIIINKYVFKNWMKNGKELQ